MLPWYNIWLMFKTPSQNFGRHQRGDPIHLLRLTASTKKMPNRSPVQKRLSIYNWNPGPRRGKEDAFEKQIAGKWHVITPQEASEYVDHDILTNRFHVTHYGGCAILYNKDTLYPNIDVKSLYLHDTRRDLPDQNDGTRPGVGYARGASTCLISSTSTQRPEDFYGVVSTY